MSFCYISRPPSPTALPLFPALRLSVFPLRVFPAAPPPLQRTRARVLLFFFRFSALLSRPTQPSSSLPPAPPLLSLPAWLPRSPMSPFCYSFCPARLRVFLARLLPLPDPFILLPGLPLSPSAFRHFSLFLYLFPERSSTSDTFLFPSLFLSFSFTLALCFSAGLACSFPFLSPLSLPVF